MRLMVFERPTNDPAEARFERAAQVYPSILNFVYPPVQLLESELGPAVPSDHHPSSCHGAVSRLAHVTGAGRLGPQVSRPRCSMVRGCFSASSSPRFARGVGFRHVSGAISAIL